MSEIKLPGSTADICNLCEFIWYQRVLFVDALIDCPNDHWVIGRYLGPAINMVSMLTSNILKPNGEVVCHPLVRHLTPDELQIAGWIKHMFYFNVNIMLKLSNDATETNFNMLGLTLVHDAYTLHIIYNDKGTTLLTKCLVRLLRR